MPQSVAETRSLPAILRDKGYKTMFFCGSDHGSMGFGAYARAAGMEHLFSREDYEAAHGKTDFDGYWGIWDEKFMQYMGEELGRAEQPFFSTMFTLTSHHPFVVPAEYEGYFPEGETANHKCVGYVDNAFRLFFKRFENEEWFKNTIFLFVPTMCRASVSRNSLCALRAIIIFSDLCMLPIVRLLANIMAWCRR